MDFLLLDTRLRRWKTGGEDLRLSMMKLTENIGADPTAEVEEDVSGGVGRRVGRRALTVKDSPKTHRG